MYPLTHLQIAIAVISTILMVVVAVGMFQKGLYRELPFFFGYMVFHIVKCSALIIAAQISYTAYFYAYWPADIVDSLVVLLVMQEIFGAVFRPYEKLRSVGTLLFRCTLLALVGIALVIAAGTTKGGFNKIIAALSMIQQSTLFIQGGLIVFLVLFSRLLGLTWRSYVFGISLGFGVMACISGLGSALETVVQSPFREWCKAAIPNGYAAAILVWAFYLAVPTRSTAVQSPKVDASTLTGWNRALGELLER